MALFKDKKQPSRRFDINQTLVNTTYQPGRPSYGKVATDPLTVAIPAANIPATKKRFLTWKKTLLLLFIVLLTPLLFVAGWDGRNISRASNKMFGTGNLATLVNSKQLKESNDERVNILLVGYSVDDPGHSGAKLTDSIMVLSLNTQEHKGYMLSIPRDLYVSIPNYGSAKINEAYQAGGIDTLEQVISDNFNIPIQYHVLIDYAAVRDIVNSLGGVSVNIKSEDPRGLYDPNFKPNEGGPLKLKNGQHDLDGETALRLTRARGSTYGSYGFPRSDFNRVENQQLVLAAIKKKIDWRLVLDPRVNEKFFDAVADNIKTNIKASEVLTMYRLFNAVPEGQLRSVSLHDLDKTNYYIGFQTPNGQSALIPAAGMDNFSQIQEAIKRLNKTN